jgi:hypothetical protein
LPAKAASLALQGHGCTRASGTAVHGSMVGSHARRVKVFSAAPRILGAPRATSLAVPLLPPASFLVLCLTDPRSPPRLSRYQSRVCRHRVHTGGCSAIGDKRQAIAAGLLAVKFPYLLVHSGNMHASKELAAGYHIRFLGRHKPMPQWQGLFRPKMLKQHHKRILNKRLLRADIEQVQTTQKSFTFR